MSYLLQFNTDFESKHVDHVEKSVPSVIQKNEKNKLLNQPECKKDIESEMFDSESFSKLLDSDFEIQTPNVEVSTNTTEMPLPLVTNANKEEVFRFYWWDAYEDPYKQPGIVYLFGKVFVPSIKEYRSCCITVKNIPRRIYLLPRVYVCMNIFSVTILTL